MNSSLRSLWLAVSIVAVAMPMHAQNSCGGQQYPAGDVVWTFDQVQGNLAHDCAGNRDDAIQGLWRSVPGVAGKAVEFDGYTTHICRGAKAVPRLGNAFTVSAWVALNNYPWNWLPVADQSDGEEVGYFFGIDAFGHVGFQASIDGIWQKLTTSSTIPLKKWTHITGVWDGDTGLSIFINGEPAGSLSLRGQFWQATGSDLLVGRVRTPQLPFPAWLSHPEDPVTYSLDGDLGDLGILDHAVTIAEDHADVVAARAPEGDVIPYAVLPAGPPGAGPFGAVAATLHFYPAWDRLRRIGDDSDVVVRFDQSAMRLVFWQGTNYIPAWVTENGKWYTDEFLETWGHGCPGAGDCEPMSDKQSRYSRVSILQSTAARAIIHWRYALAEARNYEGAHADPLTGWFDWADEYWTVYPDGVAVRRQVLWSSGIDRNPYEWQETIVINGPGQRPEDNILPDALTLENMSGQTRTYHWDPKSGSSFSFPKGPATLDEPKDANIQIVHLRSPENPFQIVWPHGLSHDTYNGEQSYSMFEWWNHWPVAQVGSSGRPAVAADRASHTSLSHIYWDPYEKTANTETKLLLCGLTTQPPAGLLPLARSWLEPPAARVESGNAQGIDYDPAQRAFVVHRPSAPPGTVVLAIDASAGSPLFNPAIVVEKWNGAARVSVWVHGRKTEVATRMGVEHHLEGDSLILYLPLAATQAVQIRIEPLPGE
jgi:hypothetical protein